MAKVLDWLKRASTSLLDPGREERLQHYVREFAREIRTQGNSFSFGRAVAEGEVPDADVPHLQKRLYEASLRRAWEDLEVTERERAGLEWMRKILALSSGMARRIELEIGREVLGESLASALSDGELSEHEARSLSRIAETLGIALGEFVTNYFSKWAESFLRAMFASIIEDARITADEWSKLIRAAQRLGLTESQVIHAVQPQAKMFLEHVLADAKSDGRLTFQEEKALCDLIDLL